MRELVGLFKHPKRRLKKLIHDGEYKQALEFGKSLVEKHPQDVDLLFMMGSTYYILADAKNALNYFDRVLKINEFDTEALFLKANVHLYLKENRVVIDCCNKILKIDSENREAQEILNSIKED